MDCCAMAMEKSSLDSCASCNITLNTLIGIVFWCFLIGSLCSKPLNIHCNRRHIVPSESNPGSGNPVALNPCETLLRARLTVPVATTFPWLPSYNVFLTKEAKAPRIAYLPKEDFFQIFIASNSESNKELLPLCPIRSPLEVCSSCVGIGLGSICKMEQIQSEISTEMIVR